MTALTNRAGPTRIWKTIKGKSVRANDGKDIGKIKEISENHLQIEEGKVHKHRFWVPKYVADAFDGKVLWLLLNEEEVRGRYQYGAEPPTGENYTSEFEKFKKTAYGQKVSYASDFNENIRVVENYSNIRDLQSTASTQIPETVKEEVGKEEDQKEQNIKDIETTTKTENIQSTEYRSKKQPINTDSHGTKSTVQPVQPIVMNNKPTELEAAVEVKQKKDNNNNNNNSSSSPIRLPTSYTKQETAHVENLQGDKGTESASPIRITSSVPAPEQPMIATPKPTSTAMDKPVNTSSITSSLSSINAYQKNTDSTKIEQKPHDNPTKSDIQSASMTAASPTPSAIILDDKNNDTGANIDIQPVLAQVIHSIEVRPEEQHIMPVSVNNEETSLDLTTTAKLKSTSIEEVKPTPTSFMPANLEQRNQISLYGNSHTYTDDNKYVNSKLGGYLDPFLVGMTMWQEWLNMYSEFAAIGASLSLNWLESFWKFLIPLTRGVTDNR